ncbi:unnamed protein product [Boreogadus saida]
MNEQHWGRLGRQALVPLNSISVKTNYESLTNETLALCAVSLPEFSFNTWILIGGGGAKVSAAPDEVINSEERRHRAATGRVNRKEGLETGVSSSWAEMVLLQFLDTPPSAYR